VKELSKIANANIKRIETLGVYKSAEGENLTHGIAEYLYEKGFKH
jgi:hypothetical protein